MEIIDQFSESLSDNGSAETPVISSISPINFIT